MPEVTQLVTDSIQQVYLTVSSSPFHHVTQWRPHLGAPTSGTSEKDKNKLVPELMVFCCKPPKGQGLLH